MTVFRPHARVTSPDGSLWEIYAYTFRWTPPRRRRDLWRAALAAARTLRQGTWTIEAVTFLPRRTAYTWTTTSEHKGHVLAQVEGSIARGDIPVHLRNADYLGEDRRSAR